MTHRQFVAMRAYKEATRYEPGLTEAYLMALRHEVRYVLASKKPAVDPKNYTLDFRSEKQRKKDAAEASKRRWLGMMTMPVEVR